MSTRACLLGTIGTATVLCLFMAGCPFIPTGTNPQLSVTATPVAGLAPLDVTFEADLTYGAKYRDPGTLPPFGPLPPPTPTPPPGCIFVNYAWDFGDGTTDTGTNPVVTHTYAAPGVYTATVTANFINCPSVTAQVSITVAAPGTPPVANAGPDQVVPLPPPYSEVDVTLDGSASYDPAKAIVQYIWTGVSPGAPDPDDVMQPVVTLGAGVHTFSLVVIDDTDLESDPDTVDITVAQPPVANAGPDQVIPLGPNDTEVQVTLDGSESYDPSDPPEKTITQYVWTGTPDPDDTMQPVVTLGAGVYEFTLVVSSSTGLSSAPDTVQITVQRPPVAVAGVAGDQLVELEPGETEAEVTLDGSESYDPSDTPARGILQYIWTGTPDPDDVKNPVVILGAGVHTFTLVVVNDAGLESEPDDVTVTVVSPPVADAGPDQLIELNPDDLEAEVTLDGSGSYDPNDTPARGILQYIWTGTPDPDDVKNPVVTLGPGVYTFTLVVVNDAGLESEPDTVTITVAYPPVANAGEDQHVFIYYEGPLKYEPVTDVYLDGSGSYDPFDSAKKAITQYIWTGASPGAPDPDDVVEPMVTLGVGTYEFTLVVHSSSGLVSQPDTVQIVVDYFQYPYFFE